MSYQVLARKYRPRQFSEMVGQDNVLKSLIHALKTNRLHHAYLFSGTRGVGKTSLARLLAKCLNCEKGISDQPCDQCDQCLSIARGNMVDLIEIDAASRTKVEDTRELLDQVQYMPTKSRFKIYLIDEIHMLSTHSFNALLKTLEEPPEHVKFLLATTDPQKLPITILSRSLQYHLQPIPKHQLIDQLARVLEKEQVSFEKEALSYLANAADGSLRDALSLTDQAISFGQGKVTTSDVVIMLGVIDHKIVFDLAKEVVAKDTCAILELTDRVTAQGKNIRSILDTLAMLWHAMSVYQLTEVVLFDSFDESALRSLSTSITPELIQLYYQITLKAKEELALVPDHKMALDMALMRMVAFDLKLNEKGTIETKEMPPKKIEKKIDPLIKEQLHVQPKDQPIEIKQTSSSSTDQDWHKLATELKLKGMARQIALNSHCVRIKNNTYYLESKVYSVTDNLKIKIKDELSAYLKSNIDVVFINDQNSQLVDQIESQKLDHDKRHDQKKKLTPAEIEQDKQKALLENTYQRLKNDSLINTIESEFDTTFKPAFISIKN